MEQEFGITPNLPIQASLIASPKSLTIPAWKYGSGDNYMKNVYYRGKLILLDMEQQVGSKGMKRILHTYSQKFRFKHPTTAEFQKVVEQTTGRSWKSYFKQYIYGDKMADFAVDQITVNRITRKEKVLYESVVDISRLGATSPKVPLLLTFKDGHTVNKVWNGEGNKVQFKLEYKEPLSFVQIDPAYTLVLENKHINNYLKASIDEPISTRTSISIVKLIEALLETMAW
ncbi:hypothetical protein D3C78_1280490 [compost metagenome]